MTRQFAWITATLTGIIGILLGIILSMPRLPADTNRPPAGAASSAPAPVTVRASQASAAPAGAINFADIAAKLNPAVVNIDAFPESGLGVVVHGQFPVCASSLRNGFQRRIWGIGPQARK